MTSNGVKTMVCYHKPSWGPTKHDHALSLQIHVLPPRPYRSLLGAAMTMMWWADLSCRDAQGAWSVYFGVFCHSSGSQNTLQKLGSFLLFLNVYTFPLAVNGRLHGSDAMDCNATKKRKSQVSSS